MIFLLQFVLAAVFAVLIWGVSTQRARPLSLATRPRSTTVKPVEEDNSCSVQTDPTDETRYGVCNETLQESEDVTKQIDSMRSALSVSSVCNYNINIPL